MSSQIIYYLLVLCFICVNSQATVDRHVLYWNSVMTPGLQKQDYVMRVKMGEFMDILCPQRSLMGITHGPREPTTFDLYNVTEGNFNECKTGGHRNFIFACDQPERENKLTIKFQTISPSPLGFRFQYCSEYYFVAIPRNGRRGKQTGCHQQSTRLRILVGCQEVETTTTTTAPTTTVPTSTIPTTTSTTTTKAVTTMELGYEFIKKLLANKKNQDFDAETIVPKLKSLLKDVQEEDVPKVLASSGDESAGQGGNSASANCATFFTTLLVMLSSWLIGGIIAA
uniref:Ephrin RBD domain-containing protein n=1 Tax=Ciona savignyi TaxID=51511 RepID=H2Y9D5_CIOSA